MPVVRSVVHEAAKSNYKFVPLLMAIIKSAPFQMQRIPNPKPLPEPKQAAVLK